ncbi:MAG TPA: nuclear transport factor 2 family protein [Gemmatimonadales bacterium]|nr:nuclear transport factor 2 family protein [Gemmatimonadales bacterium]
MPAANVRFALLCLLLIMLPACGQEPRSSPTLTPDAFAREWIEAWDSRDVDRILTYYTDDAFYEDVPTVENGWGEPLRGHQMIRESVAEGFEDMSDLGFEFVSASDAGDRLVVEWIMTGTHYRDYTGRFSIRGVSVIKLKGDKIASVSDYYDAYQLLSQLGMVPAPDAEQPRTSRDSAIR